MFILFIIFQAPFADARDFVSIPVYRLKKPNWMSINPYGDFIHRFGDIEKRPLHKKKDYTNEKVFCSVKRAFRFDKDDVVNLAKLPHGMVIHSRRFFPTEVREIGKDSNGAGIYYENKVICKIEMGFLPINKKIFINSPLSQKDLKDLITRCLNLKINVELPSNEIKTNTLINIGKYLPNTYLHATTQKKAQMNLPNWLITSGLPLLIVEYRAAELKQPLNRDCLVLELKEHNIRIFFMDLQIGNTRLKTWFVETTNKTNPYNVRMLLEGLLHINASQQCLNKILANYDKYMLEKGTESYYKFQRYLEFTFHSLFKRERFGFPCKEFSDVLQRCEDAVFDYIRNPLQTELKKLGLKGNCLANLNRYISATTSENLNNTCCDLGGEPTLNNTKNKIDILILTAVPDELEGVVAAESDWVLHNDSKGYPYYIRKDTNKNGIEISYALACACDMGAVNAANLATRLSNELKPSCLAMVGICAGWRNKVKLGDVIVADKVFSYDSGKLISHTNRKLDESQIFHDIRTYNLKPLWKQKVLYMTDAWKKTIATKRPLEYNLQETWLLKKIFEGSCSENPISEEEKNLHCPDWDTVVQRLERKKLIKITTKIELTKKGQNLVQRELIIHQEGHLAPKESKVFVKAIATGTKVVEDRKIFSTISKNVRSVLGLEMEAFAIGEIASIEQINDFIIAKAVSDYADEDKDDHFRTYAIEASYRFMKCFLQENYEK